MDNSKSPCKGKCKENGSICTGCYRTTAEIADWPNKSESEKQKIMKQLSGEESTHNCPECGQPTHCDISAGDNSCWCFEIENRDVAPSKLGQYCLCRQCIEKAIIA